MKTEFAYDTLPYSNHVFPQTHPDKLCAAAKLFGLNAPDIENSRILELGCGNGMNLISHAYSLPEAKFVGVDLAKNHIRYAEKCVAELGLKNVEFRQIDLMEMSDEEFGEFDYIIAHGLFSWIPQFAREKTLSVYSKMLAENGVGYLSYNVFPGWYPRRMVAEIGKIHTRNISDPSEKVQNAVGFIKFLADQSNRKDVYKFILENELYNYNEKNEISLFHDNLSEINEPLYFYQFAELLGENGFQFLAEAELFSMSPHSLNDDAKKIIENIKDKVWREQYLDFMRGKNFRQTLFCRSNIELNHAPDLEILDDFFIASGVKAASEKPELYTNKAEEFIGLKGDKFEINYPLAKIALYHLQKIWGNSILFSELLQIAQNDLKSKNAEIENLENEIRITREIFLHLAIHTDFIELHTYKLEISNELAEKPEIKEFARWQLNKSDLVLTGYERYAKIEDSIIKHLFKISDGTKTVGEIHAEMRKFVEFGDFENKVEILDNLANDVDEHLEQFSKAGLFV